jgi:metallophosphoesterase superfamily enzyme
MGSGELVYRDRALLVNETLVLADLHLGKGAASSVEFPLGASEDVVDRLVALLDRFDPETVVLAGDVLHAFDYVPDAASDAFAALVDALREAGARPIVLEGNHDTMFVS